MGRDFHGHDRPEFCQDRRGHTGLRRNLRHKGAHRDPGVQNPQRATLFVDGEAPLTVERPFEVNGYEYEIRETEACLRAGLTHSARITPQQSVAVMALMDKARRQNGLVFPFEAA